MSRAAAGMQTLSGDAARGNASLAAHALVVGTIILTQVIYTPAHDPSADATWHFRLARDILQLRPIYWFGVDANRFFPDLLFTLLGIVLSGWALFTTWLYFFYSIQFIAAYGALWALSTTLYPGARERLAFSILGVAALLVLTTVSPFWSGWLLEPGGHGTALSVCLGIVALALWMNRAGHPKPLAALAFVGATCLLVASNRYLLVGFVAPLLVALLAAAGLHRAQPVGCGARESRGGQFRFLIAATVTAAVGGYFAWRFMDGLSWYRLTGGGSYPAFPTENYGAWLADRFRKEHAELTRDDHETAQIRFGVALLLGALSVAAVGAVRTTRGGRSSIFAENRLIFGLFVAASACLAMAFVVIMAVETGPYHYRFLTIPVATALVFLSSQLVPLIARLGPAQGWVAAAILASLVALSAVRASDRQGQIESNRSLQHGVGELERVLQRRSTERPIRGFAEYWIAHDVTVRSRIVHLSSMQVHKAQFTLYNSNASEICEPGYFFVLHDAQRDEPKREVIIAALGEPAEQETVNIGRYPKVDVFYSDPGYLRERVIGPSKAEILRLFPSFTCSP